jgi:hypothetical protein
LKETAQKAFTLFKLQTNEKEIQMIREDNFVQFMAGNHMILWQLDNSYFDFG